jgi:hypothetical protein
MIKLRKTSRSTLRTKLVVHYHLLVLLRVFVPSPGRRTLKLRRTVLYIKINLPKTNLRSVKRSGVHRERGEVSSIHTRRFMHLASVISPLFSLQHSSDHVTFYFVGIRSQRWIPYDGVSSTVAVSGILLCGEWNFRPKSFIVCSVVRHLTACI